MRCNFSRVFLSLFALAFFAAPAFSQITGDLQVVVSDPAGAAVPDAMVTVKHTEIATTRNLTTDMNGAARATQLTIGRYEVRVSHAGFGTIVQFGEVVSGNVATMPITLRLATAEQTVTVLEEVATLNTVNAQLQTSVETQTIQNLATVSTGVLGLAATMPGIIPVTPNNPFLGLGSFNSNGGRGRGNNITLDNATSTDVSTTGQAGLGTLPLDAIKEFNIITNQFNAEYGRNSSAQVQVLSKSGSNDFHGEMFEFLRNSEFNARDYFDRSGGPVPNRDNDWGALAGGHIIPNKVFYFGTYEERTVRGLGGTRVANTLAPAQLAGATPFAQQIVANYQIPTSGTGSVTQSASNTTDTLAYSGRVDANLTSRDYFFASMGEQSSNANSAGNTWIDSNLVTNGASSANRPWRGSLTETHIFGPNVTNTFLASFGRSAPVFTPLATFKGPEIQFSDSTANFGSWNGLPQGRIQNTFEYLDTVTYIRGKHQFKFGAEVDRVRANSYFDSNVNGTITYLTLKDFLNDNPFQYQQRFGNSVRGNRVWNEFFFAQDDYRVTRNLTLNVGFREEIAGGPTEVNNLLSNLDISKTSTPLGGAGTGPFGAFYTGGSFFKTNHNPGPRFGFAWSPRGGKTVIRGGYGISYDFIFLNPITNGRFLPPFMYLFTLTQGNFTGANSLANILSGTSAFQQQNSAVVGTFGTTIKNFGAVNSYIDPNLKNPQVQQFTLTIEREVFGNWILHAGYSGSKGTYLQRTRPLNFLAPGQFTPPATLADQQAAQAAGVYTKLNNGLSGTVTAGSNRIDPRFNAVTVVESSANSIYHSLQLDASRRMTSWYSLNAAFTWSKSIDDVSDALNVVAYDTPGQQNPFDNRNNRAVSGFNVPVRLSITHDFVSRAKGISNHMLSWALDGWQFGGIFQAQSGFSANLAAGTVAGLADGTLLGGGVVTNGALRPDLIGPLNLHFGADPGGGANNPNKVIGSGLAAPLVGHFGTLGRNVVRLNPLIQSDMSLGRIFSLRERYKVHLQAQVINVFNNTTFSTGGGSGSSGRTLSAPGAFGYYQSTDTDSRRIALVGRFIW
jgi:hypothetical protein